MNNQNNTFPGASKNQQKRFSWVLLGCFVLSVALIATFSVIRGTKHEERQLIASMQDRADVLIWAVEGSARSMRSMRQDSMLALVEEVAKQPGVAYIALVSKGGQVLMHSEQSMVGAYIYTAEDILALNAGEQSQTRFLENGEHEIFEVYRAFTPLVGSGNSSGWSRNNHGHGMQGMQNMMGHMGFKGGEVIFVGMDASHLAESLNAYTSHASLMAALITLAGSACIGLLFYMQNYKLSRQMLADTRALALQVINNHPAALLVTDQQGQISLLNQNAKKLLNLPPVGQHPKSLTELPFLSWQSLIQELDSKGVILEHSTDLFISKTDPLPIGLSASKIIGSAEGFSGYLFILQNLSEIRKLEKQLKQSERLSALGNLAAGVAHEIRNPLSSIKGYAIYLAEKLKNDKMAYATGQILIEEIERLNRVVSDLLTVAKPQEIHLKPVLLETIMEQAIRIISPDAEAKKLHVQLDIPSSSGILNSPTMLDADRLLQAILNLLVNAVQATANGGNIRLSVSTTLREGQDTILGISVTDTGAGMSQETLSKLFTPYFTTKASGTGLGLAIAQRIVEQHGGEIKVFSQQGHGATFTILLPYRPETRSNL